MSRKKARTWPPFVFIALGIPCPDVTVLDAPKLPSRGPWRCRFCSTQFTRWAPMERHSTTCEARPAMTGGWIEVMW